MKEFVPRKRIALIIADPCSDYSQSVIHGVRDQCAEYNYDFLVFSTMVKVCHLDKMYLDGEINIYRLINYDMVDGVILTSLSLFEDQVDTVLNLLRSDLQNYKDKPVISLDLPFDDYPTVYTDDKNAVRKMIKHLVNKHNCNKIFFLTGHKDYVVSDDRAEAFLKQMKEEGLEASVEDVFYGNFWYTSGEEFANRILSGELAKPDAVACANDYMAIGLANRLISGGIKVPEQIRVTGYDATKDALYNTISITTYNPDVYDMAARGVNYIHSMSNNH